MFDPVLLLQMAITAFIMLTMKPVKASTHLNPQKPTEAEPRDARAFTSSDGKTYVLQSGLWIEDRILNH